MPTQTWRVVGASVIGTSHQKEGKPCQDAHLYRVLSQGVLVIAVADGAGYTTRPEEGAQAAVEQAIDTLTTALERGLPSEQAEWQQLLTEAFRQAIEALSQLATTEQTSVEDFATTLTCAVVSDDWLTVGQIGDGTAVAKATDGTLFIAAAPQEGEYVNETFFITIPDALQDCLEIHTFQQAVHAIALMTDGVSGRALKKLQKKPLKYEPHVPFFEPVLAFVAKVEDEAEAKAQLSTFLASERFCAYTRDDKTLVLAARMLSSS